MAEEWLEDKKLVRRMLAGEEPAFDTFFHRFFPSLYRFALIRVDRNADIAEEVVQTTLCRAIDKLATFRGEAALFSWLCTICRREISAWFRKHRMVARQQDLVEEIPEIRAALESLSMAGIDDPQRSLLQKELARLVQVTLDHLHPNYGYALEWKYIEGLSVKEIAGRLGSTPKAAESLLTRARVAFRDGFKTVVGGSGIWPLPKPAD